MTTNLIPPIDTAVPWRLVVSLRNRFHLKNFVETGTGYGKTAITAAEIFERVYTVEILENIYHAQRQEIRKLGNVTRDMGDSPEWLRDKLARIRGACLFYLDGHWPGQGPRPVKECPLLDELEVICSRPHVKEDVIMIDNAGMFLQPPKSPHDPSEWPTITEIRDHVGAWCPAMLYHLWADVIIFAVEPIFVVP